MKSKDDGEEIRFELARILATATFARSDSLSSLLRYTVEATLDGRGNELKEYVIGSEVLRRGADFDPRVDPIVRVQVRNLRARLEEYYSGEGAGNTVRISFEKGTYRPSFVFQKNQPGSAPSELSSIAVLPFVSMNPEIDSEYFSDGLTEELINALTRIPGLRVVARTSVFEFKGKHQDIRRIGAQLNVKAALEGSVRRSGALMRVTAQLIDTANGFHLWSNTFEGELRDVFGMQDQISAAIASALRLRLGDEPHNLPRPTQSMEAFELYLRGRALWNRRSREEMLQSIQAFERAIQLDPGFAQAYSGLADCCTMSGVYGAVPAKLIMPKAKMLAVRALALDDTLAEAHTSLGMIAAFYEWDHATAEVEFLRALAINPCYAPPRQWLAGQCHLPFERYQESVEQLRIALRYDPLSLTLHGDLASSLSLGGWHDEALEQCRKTIAMDPQFFRSHWTLGLIYERAGDFAGAVEEFRLCERLSAGNAFQPVAMGCLGHALAMQGQIGEAQAILPKLLERSAVEYVNPLALAHIHTGLGNTNAALDWLEQACEDRAAGLIWMRIDPRAEQLRSQPRFQAVLLRVGLVAEAAAD